MITDENRRIPITRRQRIETKQMTISDHVRDRLHEVTNRHGIGGADIEGARARGSHESRQSRRDIMDMQIIAEMLPGAGEELVSSTKASGQRRDQTSLVLHRAKQIKQPGPTKLDSEFIRESLRIPSQAIFRSGVWRQRLGRVRLTQGLIARSIFRTGPDHHHPATVNLA